MEAPEWLAEYKYINENKYKNNIAITPQQHNNSNNTTIANNNIYSHLAQE